MTTSCEPSKIPFEEVVKQSSKAIKALQDYKKKEESKKEEEDEFILLILSLKKIAARASVKPHRLPIPYPWREPSDPSVSVCLIVKDPLETEKQRIPSLPCLHYIDSVKGLANKHKPFEAKRLLCASHDMFLADERVLPLLPKVLGKVFFDKKKLPVPVDLKGKDILKELESAMSATYLHLSTGPCVAIKIGKLGQSVAHLQANLGAILKQVDSKLPNGGLSNIRSISVKTGNSIALPIFETN
jgi:ribosome biogenesis protein UTP30